MVLIPSKDLQESWDSAVVNMERKLNEMDSTVVGANNEAAITNAFTEKAGRNF